MNANKYPEDYILILNSPDFSTISVSGYLTMTAIMYIFSLLKHVYMYAKFMYLRIKEIQR